MPERHLSTITSGFAQLFAGQVFTRLFTFLINLLVVRQLPPEALGDADEFKREAERVTSVSFLAVPTAAFIATMVTAAALAMTEATHDPGLRAGYILHGLAAFVEVCGEPFFILTQARLLWWPRVLADTSANVGKGLTQLVLLMYYGAALHPALVFGCSQLVFAGVMLLCYSTYGMLIWRQSRAQLRLLRWSAERLETMKLVGTFTVQAAAKFVLAEGSKLVLMRVGSRYNQGVYGLVNNLGSLVVRTIFQPLEEAAFAAFSRLQVAAGDDEGLAQAAHSLAMLVRAASVPGVLALAFGPAYSYTLLRLLYGPKWAATEAPRVLAVYTGYVLLLAINGVLEAFVHAVLDRRRLGRSNAMLVASSVAHMAAAGLLASCLGTVGLVLADSVNMLLRIATSCWYIRSHFRGVPGYGLHWLLISPMSMLGCAAAATTVMASQQIFMRPFSNSQDSSPFLKAASAHVGVGAASLAVLLAVLYRSERQTLQTVLGHRRAHAD